MTNRPPDVSGTDLDAIADIVYRLSPGEFTAVRNAQAAEARCNGRRELADAVRALRRPSTAAWAVNVLARDAADELDRLIELRSQLQVARSRDELRALASERRRLVGALLQRAATLARERGRPLNESLLREIDDTVEAALADPAAGRAVRTGRLVRSLRHSGFGPVDLVGATAGGDREPDSVEPPAGPRDDSPADSDARRADEAADALRRDLVQRAEAAEEAARLALDALAERSRSAEGAEREAEEAGAVVRRLEQDLAAARVAAGTAASESVGARAGRDEAARAAEEAGERADQARADVEAIEDARGEGASRS